MQSPHDIHIAFLHTAPQHVAPFSDLMQAIAPELNALHMVREDLLIDALQPCISINNKQLIKRIKAAVQDATHPHRTYSQGAKVVVCTCSTIGGVVEALKIKAKGQSITTTRIDRAMADAAVKTGAPILLIATLESTLEPTIALLQSSARSLKPAAPTPSITPVLVTDAWSHFLASSLSAYTQAIVEATAAAYTSFSTNNTVKRRAAGIASDAPASATATAPIVVLAQASMRSAVPLLAARNIHALSSPESGVKHAVALYRQHQST